MRLELDGVTGDALLGNGWNGRNTTDSWAVNAPCTTGPAIATICINERFPTYTGGEDAVLKGLEEVNAWRERAGLSYSGGMHGITMGVHEQLNQLRSELHTYYVERLDKYATKRKAYGERLGSTLESGQN